MLASVVTACTLSIYKIRTLNLKYIFFLKRWILFVFVTFVKLPETLMMLRWIVGRKYEIHVGSDPATTKHSISHVNDSQTVVNRVTGGDRWDWNVGSGRGCGWSGWVDVASVWATVCDSEGVDIVVEALDLFLGRAIVQLLVGAPIVCPAILF